MGELEENELIERELQQTQKSSGETGNSIQRGGLANNKSSGTKAGNS